VGKSDEVHGARIAESLKAAVHGMDLVILAVKPVIPKFKSPTKRKKFESFLCLNVNSVT